MTKSCFSCLRPLPLSEFYVHPDMKDGHLNKCKACVKAYASAHRLTRLEQVSAYERKRFADPARKAKIKGYIARHRALHPDRYVARNAVANAVRDGRLTKLPCAHCGDPKSQTHHHDYSKPLDVEWLCFRCHREHAHGQTVIAA